MNNTTALVTTYGVPPNFEQGHRLESTLQIVVGTEFETDLALIHSHVIPVGFPPPNGHPYSQVTVHIDATSAHDALIQRALLIGQTIRDRVRLFFGKMSIMVIVRINGHSEYCTIDSARPDDGTEDYRCQICGYRVNLFAAGRQRRCPNCWHTTSITLC